MGAWGERTFDNDTANDWAYGLEDVDDLSLVEAALRDIEELGDDYVDQDLACCALAACEVLARLRGQAGYSDAHTAGVDEWVAAHPLVPSPALLRRGRSVIDRILGTESELFDLWNEGPADPWLAAVADLRRRIDDAGQPVEESR